MTEGQADERAFVDGRVGLQSGLPLLLIIFSCPFLEEAKRRGELKQTQTKHNA